MEDRSESLNPFNLQKSHRNTEVAKIFNVTKSAGKVQLSNTNLGQIIENFPFDQKIKQCYCLLYS